ncbi:MAG: hypothetical protein M3Q29_20610 [Chloroflexota bacterium]|nr:hypothetical protein [Chloroflexota bacterium]
MSRQPYNVTFRLTRLDDGRVRAQYAVRHLHEDRMGHRSLDMTYSGEIIWDQDSADPIWKDVKAGTRDPSTLDGSLVRFSRGHFDVVPRPLAVRVAYDIEGIEPAQRRYTVEDYVPEEDEEDGG